jgi:hypothetical protein
MSLRGFGLKVGRRCREPLRAGSASWSSGTAMLSTIAEALWLDEVERIKI